MPSSKAKVRIHLALVVFVLCAIGAAAMFWWHGRFSEDRMIRLIQRRGYLILVTLTLAGNIGLPVPEETTTILAGVAARNGWLSYGWVWVTCSVAGTVGDSLGFLLGHFGGIPLLRRSGPWLGITPEQIDRFNRFFDRHGPVAVFFARFIAGLRFLGGPMSGAAGMPFRRFLPYNALGAIVWSGVMIQLGYRLGPEFLHLMPHLNWVVSGAVVLALIVVFFLRQFPKRWSRGARKRSP